MNCDTTREILNKLIDGETHRRADEALQHLDECPACREWQMGMSGLLAAFDAAREDVPFVDIADAVMSCLPDRHPASRRASRKDYPKLILAWLGASWVAGLLILGALGVATHGWTASWSVDRIVIGAISCVKTASGVFGIAARNTLSLLDVSMRVAADATPFVLSFIALDALFLFAAFVIFFGRRRVTRTSAIFC